MTAECYSCRENSTFNALAPRHLVWDGDAFRVAHAFNSALKGWMVIICNRHVEKMSDLAPSEAAELAELMVAVPLALEQLTKAPKTYVAMFGEKEHFHLHVHVIPRWLDLPEDGRGTNVFKYLDGPAEAWVSEEEQDRIGTGLRPLILQAMEKLEE